MLPAKNVILAGVKSVTLHDNAQTTWLDLAAQVFNSSRLSPTFLSLSSFLCDFFNDFICFTFTCTVCISVNRSVPCFLFVHSNSLFLRLKFYLTEADRGTPRAAACVAKLAELNP